MPGRRMGELSYSAIDRAYPYQVALPDDICCMHNLTLIMEFCEIRGLHHVTRHVTGRTASRRTIASIALPILHPQSPSRIISAV